jgi:hypothetical protein
MPLGINCRGDKKQGVWSGAEAGAWGPIMTMEQVDTRGRMKEEFSALGLQIPRVMDKEGIQKDTQYWPRESVTPAVPY